MLSLVPLVIYIISWFTCSIVVPKICIYLSIYIYFLSFVLPSNCLALLFLYLFPISCCSFLLILLYIRICYFYFLPICQMSCCVFLSFIWSTNFSWSTWNNVLKRFALTLNCQIWCSFSPYFICFPLIVACVLLVPVYICISSFYFFLICQISCCVFLSFI